MDMTERENVNRSGYASNNHELVKLTNSVLIMYEKVAQQKVFQNNNNRTFPKKRTRHYFALHVLLACFICGGGTRSNQVHECSEMYILIQNSVCYVLNCCPIEDNY